MSRNGYFVVAICIFRIFLLLNHFLPIKRVDIIRFNQIIKILYPELTWKWEKTAYKLLTWFNCSVIEEDKEWQLLDVIIYKIKEYDLVPLQMSISDNLHKHGFLIFCLYIYTRVNPIYIYWTTWNILFTYTLCYSYYIIHIINIC